MQKKIIVLGYGKSTRAAIELLQKQYDAIIYVYDENEETLSLPTGCTRVENIEEVPMNEVLFCLKSPGIAYTKDYVCFLQRQAIPIYTDVELFLRDVEGKIIAITGTNGKTTVTTLIGEVLKQKFTDVRVCGNIGVPIAEVCEDAHAHTIFVVELSSFQLKSIASFRPDIAVVLNISDAHLDYHETSEDYEVSKAKIFSNQSRDDILIYNSDDSRVFDLVCSADATKLSVGQSAMADVCIDQDAIHFQGHNLAKEVIKAPGAHNHFNSAIAFTVGLLCGVEQDLITRAIANFKGVKHRLQYVKDLHGRAIYNDSKSTNEVAVQTALQAFQKPLIWLCGGYDRQIPYTMIKTVDLIHVKHMIIYGMIAPIFVEIAETASIPYTVIDQFDLILDEAFKHSQAGDTILFSPGAASFDLFTNFEQRGEAFLSLVEAYDDQHVVESLENTSF